MVDVGWAAAVHSAADGGVLHQVILQIHHRFCAPDEQDGIAVVQGSYLVGREQFAPAGLEICRVGAGAALALTMGFCVNCGLSEGLGNVLVGAGFIAA